MSEPTPMQRYLDADEAWSAEGRRLFGNRWGDVRHTPAARGEDFSTLRTLYSVYKETGAAWEAAEALKDAGAPEATHANL